MEPNETSIMMQNELSLMSQAFVPIPNFIRTADDNDESFEQKGQH
jgi:hypothetical protein